MDDELQRLERAFAQATSDVDVAQRLEATLLRAGRLEDVAARYREKYTCSQEYSGLGRAPRCAECRRTVTRLGTPPDFSGHWARGESLSLDPGEWPAALAALIDNPLTDFSSNPRSLCLLVRGPFGVVISGLGLRARREAAIEILQDLGAERSTAVDMCQAPVVGVQQGVSESRANAVHARFVAAGINCRVTRRTPRGQ